MIKSFLKKIIFNYQNDKKRMIGLSHLMNMREKYQTISNFNDLDFKIFSQNGEDGLLDYLLHSLKIVKPEFIEIGVGDYAESNTRFIFETRSLKGLIIDCIPNLKKKINQNIKTWRGDLNIEEVFISPENILEILSRNEFNNSDIFSLDIDGIDYWILEQLPKNFAKIAIIEYNPIFGNDLEITVPNIKNFSRNNYHHSNLCYGMSIKAAVKIMQKKNFYFIGTNLLRNNAFFVSNNFDKIEYFKNLKITKLSENVNSNIRESRDKSGKQTYLSGQNKLNEIKECEVIDIKENCTKKINEIFEI